MDSKSIYQQRPSSPLQGFTWHGLLVLAFAVIQYGVGRTWRKPVITRCKLGNADGHHNVEILSNALLNASSKV